MSTILNTRILASLGMIVFVGALIVGGTGAFFSDEETSTGNTFTAGAIDLEIDNSSYGYDWNRPGEENPSGEWGMNAANSWSLRNLDECVQGGPNDDGETPIPGTAPCLFFSFIDLKPGDFGEDTISIHVTDNDAYACMAFDLTSTPDNGINEPEADADDVTDGEDGGELQNYLSFLFWHDDGDNVLEVDEEIIQALSGLPGSVFTGGWLPIAQSGDTPLPGGQTVYVAKGWCFGEMVATPLDRGDSDAPPAPGATGFTCSGAGDHNDAQTDGIVVDVHFHAVQSRNNGQFLCSSLPPVSETAGREVGAALATYVAPTCDATVTGSNSIQTALNGAAASSTVCVDSTYDQTGDNAAIRMETPGVTLAALTRGIDLDVPVVLSADGVTVTGFTGTIGQAESPAEQAAFYFDGDATNASLTFNDVTGGVGAAVLTESGANNGGGLIQNNVFTGASQGIYINPHTGSIMIRFNDFVDNGAALAGLNGALVVANEFRHSGASQEAIGIDSTFDANPASATNNNFLNGMLLNDYGAIAVMDAEDNFFNLGAAAQVDAGEFDADPEAALQFPHN